MNCKKCGFELSVDKAAGKGTRRIAHCTCVNCGSIHKNIIIIKGKTPFYNGTPLPYHGFITYPDD